jgi:PAS domain-containing protein
MHLSAKQDSDRAAAANEVLRLVAQTAQPQQSFHRLVALLHEASGAAASVGVLFRSPLELASAGADVTPDPDALKAAAAGLAPGTVSAAALPLAHGFKSALLAPVYQVDALCGALYLLFNTTVASDEVVVHLLQAAADGAALIDRQMEQAVLTARAEQFAASLITAIHDPLITLDADRCVVTMNPAALRVFGPAHIDALGRWARLCATCRSRAQQRWRARRLGDCPQ